MLPVWGGLIAMIAFMAENSSENWSALHIERTLGGSKHEGSFGPAVLALTMGIGRTFGQVVVAHVDEGKMMRWGAIIAALGTAIVGLAPTPAVAYGGLVIAGLGGSVGGRQGRADETGWSWPRMSPK
jgi:MFS family permease